MGWIFYRNNSVRVISFKLFHDNLLLCSAFAVSTAIFVMQVTLTLHPPRGATALIAVLGSNNIHNLGFLYVLYPVSTGSLLLLITALIINNISKNRYYPNK
ncbi:MAG: HPP family protein [Campylobacterota bacterium]